MPINVTLYTFAKKENSTARPDQAGSGFTVQCILKDNTSALEPSIVIHRDAWQTADAAPGYNYAYIPAFHRYYFIRNITYEPAVFVFDLEVDALASWKTYIGNADLYVLRASAEFDGQLTDRFYPIKATYTHTILNGAGATTWWDISAAGTYILGVLSYTKQGDTTGGVNYIAMSETQLEAFLRVVFNVHDGTEGAVEGATNAVKAVFTGLTESQARNLAYMAENPFTDYIDSIIWVPGTPSGMTAATGLYFGPNYLSTVSYSTFDKKTLYRFSHSFTSIPGHPDAATRGAYLNVAPYTEYQLLLPCYGLVKIDAADLMVYTTITVTLDVDLITGQGLYRIVAGGGPAIHSLAQYYCNVGVGIKYGENKPVGTQLQNLLGVGSAVIGESPIGVLSGIANIVRERQTPGSVKGTGGGFIGLDTRSGDYTGFPVLEIIHYAVADQDIADLGAPLMKVRKPSAIPGYIIAEHGDIAAPATAQELAAIKAALEGGFFYE